MVDNVTLFCRRHGLNATALARMVSRLAGEPLHRATAHRWLADEAAPPTAKALVTALEQWPADKLKRLTEESK